MIDLEKIIRENIKNLKPYSSARDEFSGSEGVFLDANENPYGNFNRYPDPHQSELKEIIASVKEVRPENIFLGNGSDEAIDIAYRIFCRAGAGPNRMGPHYGCQLFSKRNHVAQG